jgi:predicted alpha/beta hydrolase
MKEEKREISAEDGTRLAIWGIPSPIPSIGNVLLTHGTCSDRKICLGIAKYLARSGLNCWILEWREHGESAFSPEPFNFDTIATQDLKTAIRFINTSGSKLPFFFLGHSGGGIALSLLLAREPSLQHQFQGIVLIAAQAFDGARVQNNRIWLTLIKFMCWVLEELPGPWFGLGPHREKYFIMKQWFNWNLSGKFLGSDQFDYMIGVRQIEVPVLGLAAEGDRLIAPAEGCQSLIEAFGSPEKKFISCGKSSGFSDNFSHGRLLLSKPAAREVWPLIHRWILGRLPP